jgi:hypothetical protein
MNERRLQTTVGRLRRGPQTWRTDLSRLFLALWALIACLPRDAVAQCTSLKSNSTHSAESIGIDYDDPISTRVVDQAIGHWKSCANYGNGFPPLLNNSPGTRTVTVRYVRTSTTQRCGSFNGRTITLYSFARDDRGQRKTCGSLGQNLAHELGHVLGLRDAPELGTCRHHIMAGLNSKTAGLRRVTSEECQAVGQRWWSAGELVVKDRLSGFALATYRTQEAMP